MRLFHPSTGEPVDVPDHHGHLIAYYLREGYAKVRAAGKEHADEALSTLRRAAATTDVPPSADEPIPSDSGDHPDAGTSLDL